MRDLDLNVDSPEEVPRILRRAAEAFEESNAELCASWQDAEAGRPWSQIARILERAADQIDKVL